jgi:hypothetical protein
VSLLKFLSRKEGSGGRAEVLRIKPDFSIYLIAAIYVKRKERTVIFPYVFDAL